MNADAEMTDDQGPGWKRKSFSLPTSLADWVDHRAARGEASAYIAGLIEADQRRELSRAELRDFGYTGDLEITAAGRAAARALLDRQAASRAARRREHDAA
ncbi:MAG: hypothetical protein QOH97_5581 [Actinoplanes sp.]|jgi:hypothetical protein|nr:hypothetical protein [Actinoplanes sp.]